MIAAALLYSITGKGVERNAGGHEGKLEAAGRDDEDVGRAATVREEPQDFYHGKLRADAARACHTEVRSVLIGDLMPQFL